MLNALHPIDMNKDLEPLLELRRKTKAGEVAPLVDAAPKGFWVWPGKAYWAYCHKKTIAREQLGLRRKMGLAEDGRVASVVTLCRQLHDEGLWMECGGLFPYLTAEDSWPMAASLIDEDAADDFGLVDFLQALEQRYGKLTDEETDAVVAFKTVGELAAFLERIASEDREKAQPRKRNVWVERGCLLVGILVFVGVVWLVGHLVARIVRSAF